jgi:pimeloyl-ACP methyl ester carboxylesterase
MQTPEFTTFSSDAKNRAAIVFVHGFTGDLRKTWRNIPNLLRQYGNLNDWDMLGFGYSSTRWFDLTGLWAADADLGSIALMLSTRPELAPSKYDRLAFVAHSMGGLVVQQAIVTHPDLRGRISHVVLFGTPSNGLSKAGTLDFWKRQVENMRSDGPFVQTLRANWDKQHLSQDGPFRFRAVAGERDQFVPPESSLACFPEEVRTVIPGDHISMLEGDAADAPAVQVIQRALHNDGRAYGGSAKIAIEKGYFQEIVQRLWPQYLSDHDAPVPKVDDQGAIQLGMALEEIGDPETSIRFLTEHEAEGTDVLGVLAGRLKRRWWLKSLKEDLIRAIELYSLAYAKSTGEKVNHDQAYYHGINLAYLTLARNSDFPTAREWATKVLGHTAKAIDPKQRLWVPATEADALLILGEKEKGIQRHQEAAKQELKPWQAASMQEQAIRVADLCGLSEKEIQDLAGWYENRGNPTA